MPPKKVAFSLQTYFQTPPPAPPVPGAPPTLAVEPPVASVPPAPTAPPTPPPPVEVVAAAPPVPPDVDVVDVSSEQPKASVAMIRKIVVIFMFPLSVNRDAV